jgi:hypothetical protein
LLLTPERALSKRGALKDRGLAETETAETRARPDEAAVIKERIAKNNVKSEMRRLMKDRDVRNKTREDWRSLSMVRVLFTCGHPRAS